MGEPFRYGAADPIGCACHNCDFSREWCHLLPPLLTIILHCHTFFSVVRVVKVDRLLCGLSSFPFSTALGTAPSSLLMRVRTALASPNRTRASTSQRTSLSMPP